MFAVLTSVWCVCVCVVCVQGGMYVVELMDKFSTSFPLLFVVLLEMIVISWIYGNCIASPYKRIDSITRFCVQIKTNKQSYTVYWEWTRWQVGPKKTQRAKPQLNSISKFDKFTWSDVGCISVEACNSYMRNVDCVLHIYIAKYAVYCLWGK